MKSSKGFIGIAAFVTFVTFLFQGSVFSQNPSWDTRASLLRTRSGLEAQTVGGTVYAIGGAGCGPSAGTEALVNNSWVTRSSPWTSERSEFGSAVVENKIYVFGGGDCTSFSDEAFVYDPAAGDVWRALKRMPAPRSYTPAAAAVNGKIYLFGGGSDPSDGRAGAGDVWEYDPGADAWVRKASLPTPRLRARAAVVGGKIYVIGGQTGGGTPLNSVEVYDPSNNSWSTAAPMSTARIQAVAGAINGLVYVFGGTNVQTIFSSGEVYNPATGAWSSAPNLPEGRVAASSAAVGNVLYVMGGQSQTGGTRSTLAFTAPAAAPPTPTTSAPAAGFTWTPQSPSSNEAVQFTDTSTGSPTAWAWNFGDATTSATQNPAHTYTSAGTYTVSLTATNAEGSNTVTKSVTVSAAAPTAALPVANFTWTPSSPTANQSVQFTDTSTGSPTSWFWAFGDGDSTRVQNPTHTYATAGTYTVTLAAINAAGSNTTTKTVVVAAPTVAPTANFTWTPAAPLANQPAQFTDTSTGSPTSWSWNFGDGASSTIQNPTHAYSSAGTYSVALTARNSAGSNALTKSITVVPSPLTAGTNFSVSDRGALSMLSAGTSQTLNLGYATVQPSSGAATPAGVAIFGFRQNGILVTEAGVPASPPIQSARIYAEIGGSVNTGLAIINPDSRAATLSFYFTDSDGVTLGNGSTTIPALGKITAFLNESPFNRGSSLNGTFTFEASVPVSAIAIRGLTNERGEFLVTTLPVTDLNASTGTGAVLFPHFVSGGGWTTHVTLVNPTNTTLTGTVEFRNPSGSRTAVTINGRSDTAFGYSIPPHASRKLQTSNTGAFVSSGSVLVTPIGNAAAPSGLIIFSYQTGGVTVTEAGVPSNSTASAFRLYAEASGTLEQVGSIQTGVAIANGSSVGAAVSLELTRIDGTSLGLTGTLSIPANGQVATFLNEIPGLTSLPLPFQGLMRVSSNTPIAIVALRGRYNERRDFLVTTTPPASEASPSSAGPLYLPHIVDGGGYTTQLVLFSTVSNSSAGTLQFFGSDGGALNIGFGSGGSGGALRPLPPPSTPPAGRQDSTLTVTENTGTGTGAVTSVPAGIDCGTRCTATFAYGTSVTLTAAWSPDSATFAGWYGVCSASGTEKTCTITMDGDKSVGAIFNVVTKPGLSTSTHTVQVFQIAPTTAGTSKGTGKVTSDPPGIDCAATGPACGAHFGKDGTIQLTAKEDPSASFDGWTGDCASAGKRPCILTIDSDKKVNAIFSVPSRGEGGPVFGGRVGVGLRVFSKFSTNQVWGTVTSKPEGINCTNRDSIDNGCVGNPQFAIGLPVVLTATPAPGYKFEGWSGPRAKDCEGSTDPCTVLAWASGAPFDFIDAVFAPINPATPVPPPACVTAPLTITVSPNYGLITWVNLQRVAAGFVLPPAATVVIPNVPRGVYTLWIVAGGRVYTKSHVRVNCGFPAAVFN